MENILQEKTVLDTPDAPSVDLATESDVKLWLQHTGFFDVDHRQKVLGALRQLKALDEQRQKIISEIHHATPYAVPPSTPVFSQSQSVYSPSPYSALARYHATGVQSAGELCGSEPSVVDKGADSESAYSTFEKESLSSQQHDIPAPDSSVKHAQENDEVVTSPDNVDDAGLENQKEQSLAKKLKAVKASDTNAWPDEGVRPSTPTQEARFFLVKSFNSMNVEMAQRDGLWITKAENGPMLSFAFKQCKTVYLIFSINKSKAFQGYARMTTAPDLNIAPAKWMSNISWKASYPFRIEWLNTRRTAFWTLGDLKNAFNDDAPVFVGRDGQEYPEDCGHKILEVLDQSPEESSKSGGDSPKAAPVSPWATLASPRSHAKSGKTDALSWRRQESSGWSWDEAAPPHTGSEAADDLPLIELEY
ncbi:hypothetical protein TGAMA5MH_10789 [Trichoderma gamsii]|uniref:YTH domain-containing protein n=1 Tax=Trichoderma gamsii TaxID=398673 RepID=A0A2K0SVJ8_9HYPO|nr:hypothetical protein TGAMA5MH_10789 [Trichoderma gamsii]